MYIHIMYSKYFTESDKDFFTYLKTPYPPHDQTILNKMAALIEIKHEISSFNTLIIVHLTVPPLLGTVH